MNFQKTFSRLYFCAVDDKEPFMKYAGELYKTQQVQGLMQYEQHLQINRLQHITAVARVAVDICEKLGVEAGSAARGAVMHDLFYYDWRDGINGKWHCLHGYKHPRYSARNAKQLYEQITRKEEKIILRHMWPLTVMPPESVQGFAVSLADKYCATLELLYSKGIITAEENV
ncbi:MAG: HAD family hydrolase [Clostridia bacterium]|nr:HAD family hydrolase [Clostridia bacterium]